MTAAWWVSLTLFISSFSSSSISPPIAEYFVEDLNTLQKILEYPK